MTNRKWLERVERIADAATEEGDSRIQPASPAPTPPAALPLVAWAVRYTDGTYWLGIWNNREIAEQMVAKTTDTVMIAISLAAERGQTKAGDMGPVSESSGTISGNAEADRRGDATELSVPGQPGGSQDAQLLRSATSAKAGGLNPSSPAPHEVSPPAASGATEKK